MPASRKNLPIVALALFLPVACGGGADADADAGGAAAAEADAYTVPAAEAAVITGVVRFDGAPPAPEPIEMSDEPTCAEQHGAAGPSHQRVAVNDAGTLRNVFVSVRDGLGDRRFATATEPVVIDQHGCMY